MGDKKTFEKLMSEIVTDYFNTYTINIHEYDAEKIYY